MPISKTKTSFQAVIVKKLLSDSQTYMTYIKEISDAGGFPLHLNIVTGKRNNNNAKKILRYLKLNL